MTDIRLAIRPGHYRKCHSLMRKLNSPWQGEKLAPPTVMAERDGRLVGFLATQNRSDALVAGPLVLDVEKNGGMLYLRLVDAYDAVLRAAGVSFYYFHIPDSYGEYRRLVEKAGFRPLEQTEDGYWYKRVLYAEPHQTEAA